MFSSSRPLSLKAVPCRAVVQYEIEYVFHRRGIEPIAGDMPRGDLRPTALPRGIARCRAEISPRGGVMEYFDSY